MSSSKSKLLIYDLENYQGQEAKLISDDFVINNPHDVAINKYGVIVANLNPAELWLFLSEPQFRNGKAVLEPLSLEEPKAIIVKTALDNRKSGDDTHLWKSMGILLVFTTGFAMIFVYISK